MKHKTLLAAIALLAAVGCSPSHDENNQTTKELLKGINVPLDKEPGVYFVNLKDGDTVKSPVIVQMGVRGMEVEPAGEFHHGMGHHHLIVDGGFVKSDQLVIADSTHIHFGKGQTADTLKLSPGRHTLTLQFANGVHMSYGRGWSKTIAVNVTQ